MTEKKPSDGDRHATRGAEPEAGSASAVPLPNLPWLTLGGNQFWTDHHWRRGWRLQQHALSGHWRLLNPHNTRIAWGSREACEHVLEQRGILRMLEHRRIVVLLHGLLRSWRSMGSLGHYLASNLQANVAFFEYASSRGSIATHAAALAEMLGGLPVDVSIDLVGHSMGNIVIRHMLADRTAAGDTELLRRIEHIVMLGPPNQGASIARALAPTGIFGLVTGMGGRELGVGWPQCSPRLAVPTCPFGIIAGRLPYQNPLVSGAGDFIVSVEETKLAGAADFMEVPQLHSFLMNTAVVQEAVKNFLLSSRFSPTVA